MQSPHMMQQCSKFALFLGDLSMHCNEADLEEAFSPYGTILEIRVKRSKETAKTLSYGFLEFASASSAVNAMNDMDGVILKGRPLRIRWAASKKNPVRKRDIREDLHERISMHVKFMSYKIDKLITEELLRGIFSIYGEVCDTTIKQVSIDRKSHRLKGYGFVSFYNDDAGYSAVQRALAELQDATLDDVTYKVELSNILDSPAPQMYPTHAGMGGMHGMSPHMGAEMGGLNAFGELGYDATQQPGSCYDDYSAHYAEQSPYLSHQTSFESASGFERSPATPLSASSPGALTRGISGASSLLLSGTGGGEGGQGEFAVTGAAGSGFELRAPLAEEQELTAGYTYGSGASTPSMSASRAAADAQSGFNGQVLQPGMGNGNFPPRPHSASPRPFPYPHQHSAPPFPVHGPNQGRYANGYRDAPYGQALQHQNSAPVGYPGQEALPQPPHLRRAQSNPHQGYGQQPQPTWQQQQQQQQQYNYVPGVQNQQFAPRYGGNYGTVMQQQQLQGQGRFQPSFNANSGNGFQQNQQQANGTNRPPIYARATSSQSQTLQPQQLQQLAQQYAQRDLLVSNFDLPGPGAVGGAVGAVQPPSPAAATRSLYSDLPLDVLDADLTSLASGQTVSTGTAGLQLGSSSPVVPLSLADLNLGSSSTAEPFPLRDTFSRSVSSHTSHSSGTSGHNSSCASVFAPPQKPSSMAVAALNVPSPTSRTAASAMSTAESNLWLPSAFDLPI